METKQKIVAAAAAFTSFKNSTKKENDLEGAASSGALKQGALPDMLAVL